MNEYFERVPKTSVSNKWLEKSHCIVLFLVVILVVVHNRNLLFFLLTNHTPDTLIQRIQTIYLSLAAIAAGSLYFTPVKAQIYQDPAVWISVLFTATVILAAITPLIAIFLFANRGRQMSVVRAGLFFAIALLGFAIGVLLSMGGFGRFMLDEIVSAGLPLLSVALHVFAVRAIRKDEELVKSIDRIR